MSERAWLVEWRFNGVQWLYLWPSAPGGFSFTADPNSALRFARREDAEAALKWARDTDAARRPIGSLSRHGLALGEMLVTDHEWNASASPQAPAQPEPSDRWYGAEEWMPLAWELCADECGEEACNELVWEGGPVPEPWGERWLKYEYEAKRLIALVRQHVPAASPQRAVEPLKEEHINALYVSGWGAYCSRKSFIAIFREAERAHGITKEQP